MSNTIDLTLFEYIICQNSLNNSEYLTSIIDYYQPFYFTNPDIIVVMNKTVEFFQKRNNLPSITELKTMMVGNEQNSLVNVLNYISTLDIVYNIDELYENTEQFLRERAVYNALLKTTTDLKNGLKCNTEKIFDTFQTACNISLIDNLGTDYFEQINQLCDEFVKTNRTISTGWKWLDERIGGGFMATGRALYIFTGFTNVGKSIFLGNIAINVLKQNKTVLLFTLEMPEIMYAKRTTSSISQVPFVTIQDSIDNIKMSITDFKNKFESKLIIKEFPTKGMTINHMNSFIKKLIKRGVKPDIIIVDYLNLMKGTKSDSSTYEDVKELAEQLRASTYLFKIPCVTATQLNRKGAGKEEPGMETVSESIGVSFTSDGQFSIWSDQMDKDLGRIHLGIQKNRYGPNYGHTMLKIDYKTMTLSEFEEESLTLSSTELTNVTDTLDGFSKKLN